MKHPKLVGAVSNCAVATYHGTYALEQFFEDKEIKVRPSKNVSLKKKED